ncbi:hypothetical protein K6U18_13295, partial [Vibrio fluvialis]|nr:hypothetical protein [Vibrio fluvialis]
DSLGRQGRPVGCGFYKPGVKQGRSTQGIAKVNQHLAQAQTSLEQARQYHSELNTQMQTLRSQTRLLSSEQTTEKLTQFHAAADQFSSTYQALNAQANVRRHTVVALLR